MCLLNITMLMAFYILKGNKYIKKPANVLQAYFRYTFYLLLCLNPFIFL